MELREENDNENTFNNTQRKSCTYGLGGDLDTHSLERFWFWLVWPPESWLRHGRRRGTARHGKNGKSRGSACRTAMCDEVQCSGFDNCCRKERKASGSAIHQ